MRVSEYIRPLVDEYRASMKEVLGVDGLGDSAMAMVADYSDLGQTASAPTRIPGNRMDNAGIFGDDFKNYYHTTDLFGLGAVVPTIPIDSDDLYQMPTMTQFSGLGAVVPTLPTRASLYARPTMTQFSGLGQIGMNVSSVEKLAEIAAIGGGATWLLMPSSKAKDVSSKVLGAGLAAVAILKLARAAGWVS